MMQSVVSSLVLSGMQVGPPPSLLRQPIVTALVGTERVAVHHDADGLTAWAENSQGELLPGVLAYESGWLAFYPDSAVYEHSNASP